MRGGAHSVCSLASAANNEVIDNSPAAFPLFSLPSSMVVRPATGGGVPKEGRGERARLVYHQVPLLFRPPSRYNAQRVCLGKNTSPDNIMTEMVPSRRSSIMFKELLSRGYRCLLDTVGEGRKVHGWLRRPRFLASSLLSSARVVRKWVSDRGNSLLSLSLSRSLSLHHCFNVNDLIPGYRIRRRFQGGTEGGLIYRIAKIGRNKFFFPMFPYDWRGGYESIKGLPEV